MGHEPEPPAGPAQAADDRAEQVLQDRPAAAPPETHPSAAHPCPVCGGANFRWGWLETGLYGIGKGPPAEQTKWVKRKTRFGSFIGLRARLCSQCGHVEVFASDVEEA